MDLGSQLGLISPSQVWYTDLRLGGGHLPSSPRLVNGGLLRETNDEYGLNPYVFRFWSFV
jgi:hypothetical protein